MNVHVGIDQMIDANRFGQTSLTNHLLIGAHVSRLVSNHASLHEADSIVDVPSLSWYVSRSFVRPTEPAPFHLSESESDPALARSYILHPQLPSDRGATDTSDCTAGTGIVADTNRL